MQMHELIRAALNRYYAPFSLMGFIKNADRSRSAHRETAANRTRYHDVGDSNAVMAWQQATAAKFGTVPERVLVALTPERNRLQMVFIDDIKGDEFEVVETVPGHVFVETSHENWQVHFILSKEYSIPEAQSIQAQLREQYGGDIGAVAGLQPRRHPLSCLTIAEVLDRPPCNLTPILKAATYVGEAVTPVLLPASANVPSKDMEAYQRRWEARLCHTGGDESAADFAVALSCIGDRLSDEVIGFVLATISRNLASRKKDIGYYVALTVKNAREYRRNMVLKK
jgi:hypothetical protein